MHRQRQFLAAHASEFGDFAVAQLRVRPRGVFMNRGAVVDAGLDAEVAQRRGDRIPVLEPCGEQVIDTRALGPLFEQGHAGLEQSPVVRRVRTPSLVPFVEVDQLNAEQRGLETVEALVVAELNVVALGPLTEVPQTPEPRREHVVVGADRSAVPKRPQVLARVERERRGGAKRTGAATAITRPVRLGRILEEE